MESGDSHKHVTCPPSGTDNSQQLSTEADVDFFRDRDNQSHEPVFYLQLDDDDDDNPSGSRDDATKPSTGTKLIASDNKNSHSDRETIQAGTAITDLDGPGAVQVLRSDGGSETLHEADSVSAASAEDPRSSSSRTIPPVQRAHSSPLTTVCRSSHSAHLEVKCQVTSHDLPPPHPSTSCPAAFSPVWPQVVQPVPASSPRSKTHSKASAQERRRRHTVGPTTQSAQQLQHLQRMYGISSNKRTDHGSQQEGGIPDHHLESDDVQRGRPQGRERSMSDSDIQFLMMKEMGKFLRLMSDEFNCIKTGQELTPVEESAGSEDSESSDDDVN